jgi:GNAT superfamily N-acetyltransferase
MTTGVAVRPVTRPDLDEVDRIYRIAFGTFVGLPDPASFGGDSDYVRTRWAANPGAALAAVADGAIVGSNFAANWGSVGFFGPLTVAPPYWDRGVGRALLDATMDLFSGWGTRHAGLFTFSHSIKHVSLYQRYGFWPRMLTAIMSKPAGSGPPPGAGQAAMLLTSLPASDRKRAIDEVRGLTDAVYPGLDVSREIDAVLVQELGDVVLIADDAGALGVAVCHVGAGSEAGGGTCYVKFGAVRPGPAAARSFESLLSACERLAAGRGAVRVVAGVNGGCDQAWAVMTGLGFRASMLGVAMHRPNDAGYHRSECYVIDDWR